MSLQIGCCPKSSEINQCWAPSVQVSSLVWAGAMKPWFSFWTEMGSCSASKSSRKPKWGHLEMAEIHSPAEGSWFCKMKNQVFRGVTTNWAIAICRVSTSCCKLGFLEVPESRYIIDVTNESRSNCTHIICTFSVSNHRKKIWWQNHEPTIWLLYDQCIPIPRSSQFCQIIIVWWLVIQPFVDLLLNPHVHAPALWLRTACWRLRNRGLFNTPQ